MTKRANELIFISQIKRDGSGVEMIDDELNIDLQNNNSFQNGYVINRLSISEKTYIASGFNSFVVKLKQ
jgi:hypothetical protein